MLANIQLKKRIIVIFIMALATAFFINIPLNIADTKAEILVKFESFQDENVPTNNNDIINEIVVMMESFQINNIYFIFLVIGIYFFYDRVYFKGKEIKRKIVIKAILSLLFVIFTLIGESYSNVGSWNLLFGSWFRFLITCFVGLGYYMLYYALINLLFDHLFCKVDYKNVKNKIISFIFDKHSFIIPFIIIIVCWLPYIIIYYPGILTADSTNQIKQFYGIDIGTTTSTNSVKLIDENVKITNHHPVLHTLIIGNCVKIGKTIFNNDNFGIFIYTFLQVVLLASSLAYIINYMKRKNCNYWIRIISLIFFSLFPVIPLYAIEVTKDTPFTALLIIYTGIVYDLIQKEPKKKFTTRNILLLSIICISICLFRNNGIYVILLSLPFIGIVDKVNRKKLIILTVTVFLLYKGFINIVLPFYKIPNTGIQEMLSIPLQQTARYVKYYPDDITEEEKKIIDKVLIYDTLGERYNPERSDSVKNKFNKEYTSEDLSSYFKVWFSLFFRHPFVYIEATINNYYGYFYPNCLIVEHVGRHIVNSAQDLNNTLQFKYDYLPVFYKVRCVIYYALKCFQQIPIISLITNIGINTWMLLVMIAYLVYRKLYKYILAYMPAISILLAACASPVNNYFRYAMPYIFSMPLLICLFFDIIKVDKKNKTKFDMK